MRIFCGEGWEDASTTAIVVAVLVVAAGCSGRLKEKDDLKNLEIIPCGHVTWPSRYNSPLLSNGDAIVAY